MYVYRMSELNEFLTCERRYFHKYVENLESVRFSGVPREVGTAVHAGVEQLYLGSSMKDALVAAKMAYDEAIAPFLPNCDSDQLKDINTGWEQAHVCIARYPYRANDDPDMKVEVLTETTIIVNMDDGRGLKVRLDRLVTTPEGLWVHDTKTTGLSIDLVAKAHRVRQQFHGYALAAQQYTGKRPLGVLVDYVAKPRVYARKDGTYTISDPKYTREPINITEHELTEFKIWFHQVVDRLEQAKLGIDGAIYLKNSDACINFNRLCPYWDLCARPQFASAIKPTLYRVRPVEELQSGAVMED